MAKNWLDKYNAPEAENGIEGTMGGLTDIPFNYNGAWGGPSMQGGGSLPGATGHFYARYEGGGSMPGDLNFSYPRTKNIPSKGPYGKKTLASAQDGIKTFYKNYINSPKYKERLALQEYENPDKVVSDRVNHLIKTKLNIIKDTGEFTGNNIGSGYNSPTNIVDYDEFDLKMYPGTTSEDIKVHEFSHAVGALSPKNNSNLRLNKKEAAEINLRNKNKQEHERNPEEAKADMDVLRYHLKKDKLYDTGTQEFTPELYNKAKQKYKNNKTIKRFFNRFSDKD